MCFCFVTSTTLPHLGQRVVVTGKGNKPRDLPISPKTAAAIDRYLRRREKHPSAGDPHLWLSHRGGAANRHTIYQMVATLGELIGMPGLHPHLFRHTWAHLAKENDMSLDDLKTLGGWSSMQMPLRYGKSAAHERAMKTARRLNIGDRY